MLRQSVENVVAIVRELDRANLGARPSGDRIFFDVLSLVAFSYSTSAARILAAAALLLALGAWVRLIVVTVRRGLVSTLLMTAVWSLVAACLITSLLIGLTWALRVVRGLYHPWYAHPDRLLALLAFAVLGAASLLCRAGSALPRRLRGSADSRIVWCVALPVWALLAAVVEVVAPAASYLWVVPLLVAGLLLLMTPIDSKELLRVASFAVLVAAAALWIRDVHVLHGFVVEQMARLPLRPPAFIYTVVPAAAAVMLVPPGFAAFHSEAAGWRTWLRRGTLVGAILCAIATFIAPWSTFDRPLRRSVRYTHDEASGRATWEVGSLEFELGVETTKTAPQGWEPVDAAFRPAAGWRGPRMPFRYRAPAEPKPFPGAVEVQAVAGEALTDVRLSVRAPEGSEVVFAMPAEVPIQHPTLPGRNRARSLDRLLRSAAGSWRHARLWRGDRDLDRLGDASVSIDVPRLDGPGWQGLPSWLADERAVWAATAVHIRPVAGLIQRAAGVTAATDQSRLR